MSLKICTSEYMISDTRGLGLRRSWLPRVVAEQFLTSTKDGEIKLSPDPVTMIEGDLSWYNNSQDPQHIWVLVHRGPRTIVAQNPATVVIHDAWTKQVGKAPQADYPSVSADTFGGRLQIDRASVAKEELQFGRYFLDGDDSLTWVAVGTVLPEESFHFRYLAAVQTPGIWIIPSEFEPRWEAYARWTRLVAVAAPVDVDAVIPPAKREPPRRRKPTLWHAEGTMNLLPWLPFAFPLYNTFAGPLAGKRVYVNSLSYPASVFPSMLWSVDQGVKCMIKNVRNTTGRFFLAGESQGAWVMSKVYNEIRYGSLRDRRKDFMGGFAVGNPVRQDNYLAPGVVDPRPGENDHGIAPASWRLTDCEPDLWWEFANPGDWVAANNDTPTGLLAEAIFVWFVGDWDGTGDAVEKACEAFPDEPVAAVTEVVEYLYSYLIEQSLYGGTLGHLGYVFTTPIDGDDRTTYEIAVDRIAEIAALTEYVVTP